ncbi:hypothetical protein J2T57_002574 [Natronocella acetinitrilica]|uniref:Uncharacterized protein n=1 Tax=Natronocella acetinitrilica TaxID=414046 RepID=A0AAE3KC69_9GAMM|nr:hypothetical protein [Natronocella acetinitrilica]MCP1675424.1 hypothetical protein [Natronocella acetinitrilica]
MHPRNTLMSSQSLLRLLLGFLAAVVLTVLWGSIVQTQYNLAALTAIGADIGPGINLRATLADIFSGFSLMYGGYVVLPALLVAFVVAWLVVWRFGNPLPWFGLAGGLAILVGIPLVNWLSPLALLIGATRDVSCTILMALGGVAAGVLFAWVARLQPPSESRTDKTPARPVGQSTDGQPIRTY